MIRSRNKQVEGLSALALAAVTVLLLDVIAPQSGPNDTDEAVVVRAPVGGSWVCTAGIGGANAVLRPIFGENDTDVDDDEEETTSGDMAALAAEPDVEDDELFDGEDLSSESGDEVYEPAPRQAAGVELVIARPDAQWDVIGSVLIRAFAGGEEVDRVRYSTAAAGEIRYTVADQPDASFVEVSWSGPPVTVSRIWSLPGDPIPATLAGSCQTTSAHGFVAPGFSTANGANVRLRIANPYPSSASVSVRFFTPDGVQEPAVLSNLSISPFSVYETVVNDVLPELGDVSAQIDVLAGRVAVEGSVYAAVTGGATRGMGLLPVLPGEQSLMAPEPATDDTLGEPGYIHAAALSFDSDEADSWLWFTNVSDSAARADLVLHTTDGAAPPDGLVEVSIPPRSVRRIALTQTFPAGETLAGVSARTDSPALYMAVGSDLSGGAGPRGIGITAGQPADTRWVLSAPRSDRRSEQVLITNVSDEDVSVDMWFHDGQVVTEPEELQARLIPAGTSSVVDLDAFLVPGFGYTVFVRAPQEQVVVATFGYTQGVTNEHLVLDSGVGSKRWLVRSPNLPVRHEEGLIRRLAGRDGS